MDIQKEIERLKHIPLENEGNIFSGILDVLDQLNKVDGNLANSIHFLQHTQVLSRDIPEPQEELKPCPFCGSKNVDWREAVDKTVYYSCRFCGGGCGCHHNLPDAKKAWNGRSNA